MKCSNCGKELKDGTLFCSACGVNGKGKENVRPSPWYH